MARLQPGRRPARLRAPLFLPWPMGFLDPIRALNNHRPGEHLPWLADGLRVLGGRDVWHQRDVRGDQAGQILPLDWSAPFPAQWRVDWRLTDRLAASWEMVAEQSNGEFIKHGWFGNPETVPATRLRWTTVYGRFEYPCWVDREGRGFLQPLKRTVRFDGPAVIYPINRARTTPLDQFTVVDVVRATLGVGPCEYILDVEGQGATRKGRATCATRGCGARAASRPAWPR